MLTSTNLIKYKILWITGAMERLATLGFLQPTPYQVSQKAIEEYLILDENRDKLFHSNDELKQFISVILRSENQREDLELLENMYVLVKDYKDNRTELVKYALSCDS